jgi:hypothetical protein
MYCAMKRKTPDIAMSATSCVQIDALKAGTLNSRKSINGSARSRCRTTNATRAQYRE